MWFFLSLHVYKLKTGKLFLFQKGDKKITDCIWQKVGSAYHGMAGFVFGRSDQKLNDVLSLLAQELSNNVETKHRRYECERQNQNNDGITRINKPGISH